MRMDEMHSVPSEGTSMFLPHLHVYRLVLVFRGIHISIDEGLMRAPRKAFDVHAVAKVSKMDGCERHVRQQWHRWIPEGSFVRIWLLSHLGSLFMPTLGLQQSNPMWGSCVGAWFSPIPCSQSDRNSTPITFPMLNQLDLLNDAPRKFGSGKEVGQRSFPSSPYPHLRVRMRLCIIQR